jgi:hypothetical protein
MTSIDDSTHTPPGYWFGVIEGRLHQRMRDTLADLGLRRGGWRILHTLADGPATVDELADKLPHGDRKPGRPSFGDFGGGRGRAHGYGRHPGWRSQEPRDERAFADRSGDEQVGLRGQEQEHGRDHGQGFDHDRSRDHGHDFDRDRNHRHDFDHDRSRDHDPDERHHHGGHHHGGKEHAFERGYERGFDRGFALGALRGPHIPSPWGAPWAAAHPGASWPAPHPGAPWSPGYGQPGRPHPGFGYGHAHLHGWQPAPDGRSHRGPDRDRRRAHRIHRTLADFVERGWVWFDGDRATLTDEGRAAHDAAFERVQAVRAELVDGIPEADYATTMATLEAMARNLGWRPAGGRTFPEDGQAGEPSMDA